MNYEEIQNERIRAHLKHRDQGHSMEHLAINDPLRLPVLVEEVGEVARAMQDQPDNLRHELVQVAAMACAWIDAIDRETKRQRRANHG